MPTGLPLRAAAAIVVLFLCAGSAAVAQTLEGEWTNTPSWCGREYWVNNDNIHIGSDGYRVLESSCEFTGGTRFSSEHWLMKGRCAGEGPDGPGPEITIVDPHGLADPLLARLPVMDTKHWRIGHFRRQVPDGYMHARQTGSLEEMSPALAQYYAKLRTIVADDVWSWNRLRTIAEFNIGRYDHWLEEERAPRR